MCWYFLPEVLLHFYEAFVGIFAADFSKGASELTLSDNKKEGGVGCAFTSQCHTLSSLEN